MRKFFNVLRILVYGLFETPLGQTIVSLIASLAWLFTIAFFKSNCEKCGIWDFISSLSYEDFKIQILVFLLVQSIFILFFLSAFKKNSKNNQEQHNEQTTNNYKELIGRLSEVVDHERIMLANPGNGRSGPFIMGVRTKVTTPIVNSDRLIPQTNGKWDRTRAILRYRSLQDLLFDPTYLEHFFLSRGRTESLSRVMVVNEKVRNIQSLIPFLVLSRFNSIDTYLLGERSYNGLLIYLAKLESKEALFVIHLLENSVELSDYEDAVTGLYKQVAHYGTEGTGHSSAFVPVRTNKFQDNIEVKTTRYGKIFINEEKTLKILHSVFDKIIKINGIALKRDTPEFKTKLQSSQLEPILNNRINWDDLFETQNTETTST